MSEEEMKKEENLEHEVIDRLKTLEPIDFDYNAVDASYVDAMLKARNIILDLYNKEKEKNNELENADLTTVYMNGFYDGEKKLKDKIIKYKNAVETKISSIELDRDYGRYKRYGGKIKCEKYLAQLYGYNKALQDLLEEDNK